MMRTLRRETIYVGMILLLLGGFSVNPLAYCQDVELSEKVQARQTLRTPAEDELLYELETDFVELLKKSKNFEALLDAERLLESTDEGANWTNYSSATRILRQTRDIAAIPLLLRYIVLHSRHGNAHIRLPEYVHTISIIAGKDLTSLLNSLTSEPSHEESIRTKVQELCDNWWSKDKLTLSIDSEQMSTEQLHIVAAKLLESVRSATDFSGAGGKSDSAYGAYHNVYYRLNDSPYGPPEISPLHPSMLPMLLAPSGFLAPSGYPTDQSPQGSRTNNRFPFEAVIVLREIAKNGGHEEIKSIVQDDNQNSTVHLICLLALYRAGYPYDTEKMLLLLTKETDLERRLIALLSLRWGDERATAALLTYLDDANIEIATAAACALVDARPPEAAPKLKKLLDRNFEEAPLMLFSTIASFDSRETRAIIKDVLIEALEGKKNSQHLYRLLDAFADAWKIPREVYTEPNGTRDDNYARQARLALNYGLEQEKKKQADFERLTAVTESMRIQLKVATDIQKLRRDEYKRLLALQGDDVVSSQESQRAQEQLQAASAEVESLRSALREKEALLNSFDHHRNNPN